jgi:CubicO group peptidase (beta-lactamase class C family)
MERPDAETWTAALGVSDLQHGMPMRPDLHMRIGSITKSVLEASVSSSLFLQ